MASTAKVVPMRRKMPQQRPTTSEQAYGTPPEFIAAVQKRFGRIVWDLAASATNRVVPQYFDEEADSLKQSWHAIAPDGGWLWLNPEFGDIPRFAEKCAEEMRKGAHILSLTPASVGANWFHDSVTPNAHVIELGARMKFVGAKDMYPKDLILSVWMRGITGRSWWKWTEGWPVKSGARPSKQIHPGM
jgi:phage N-6-adenine-methyltransferase